MDQGSKTMQSIKKSVEEKVARPHKRSFSKAESVKTIVSKNSAITEDSKLVKTGILVAKTILNSKLRVLSLCNCKLLNLDAILA